MTVHFRGVEPNFVKGYAEYPFTNKWIKAAMNHIGFAKVLVDYKRGDFIYRWRRISTLSDVRLGGSR